MSHELERRAAGLLVVGFRGQELDGELERLLARGVGGVVLFARNVGTAREVYELTSEIKRRAGRRVLVAVDQEGGKVARLREGFTPLPPFRALGKSSDGELALALGGVVGRELRAVGIDWNFAPVLDVDTNPDNPVIGERALGADPKLVARLALAFAAGLDGAGVAACGKHFPGHGDTRQDSHFELPRLGHDLTRLERIELVPFAEAARAGLPSLMTAHIVFERLDAAGPATMSRAVVTGLLRERLGYAGVVITDDLEMRAIADYHAIEEVVVRGLDAGIDAFLCCHTPELAHRAIAAIIKAVNTGTIPEARLAEASARMLSLTDRYARAPGALEELSALASAAHLSVVERVRAFGGAAA